MLRRVILKNYRCFDCSEVAFRRTSIIVGQNNAGKSTVIEALRIISVVTQKFKRVNYVLAPSVLGLPLSFKGIKVNVDSLKIDLRTVVHKYREAEGIFAEITAFFDGNISIHVYLSSEVVFAIIQNGGKIVKSKADALKVPDIHLFIMPQIGLIREDELLLNEDTVRSNMFTRLSSRHFRNQLYLEKEYFDEFRETAQRTWPGLRITDLEFSREDKKLGLYVYDAEYASEIGLMGSGLQMWLQMVWFISKCIPGSTVVLDEPDVYMHPDLQQKILKIVERKFKQTIIATHSVEIISSVEPNEIVTVDKSSRRMTYADNLNAVQKLVNNLGSDYNLSLVRLGSAGKCVFVEGKDIKTLAKFHEILFPDCNESLTQLPTVELGGWSRFNEALGAARLFYEETSGEIETICILDRDYHIKDEINELYLKAQGSHLKLFVWEKKEIENYILTPQSIFRLTKLDQSRYEEFRQELFEEINQLYDQTIEGYIDQFARINKANSPSTNLKLARAEVRKHWDSLEGRLSVCNGKDLVSLINGWLKSGYNVASSREKLIKALTPEDIAGEVKDVISALVVRNT